MLEHHCEGLLWHTFHCFFRITLDRYRHFAIVLHSSNEDTVAIMSYHAVVVDKQTPSHLFLTVEHQLMILLCGDSICPQIVAVVVIAKYGEDAVTSTQFLQYRHGRKQFVGVHVLQVAHKRYHLCMLAVQRVNDILQPPHASPDVTPHMGITEKGYPISVERCWQMVGRILHMTHIDTLATEESTVNHQQHAYHAQHHAHSAPMIATRPSFAFT